MYGSDPYSVIAVVATRKGKTIAGTTKRTAVVEAAQNRYLAKQQQRDIERRGGMVLPGMIRAFERAEAVPNLHTLRVCFDRDGAIDPNKLAFKVADFAQTKNINAHEVSKIVIDLDGEGLEPITLTATDRKGAVLGKIEKPKTHSLTVVIRVNPPEHPEMIANATCEKVDIEAAIDAGLKSFTLPDSGKVGKRLIDQGMFNGIRPLRCGIAADMVEQMFTGKWMEAEFIEKGLALVYLKAFGTSYSTFDAIRKGLTRRLIITLCPSGVAQHGTADRQIYEVGAIDERTC